jgi:N-acetylglutamate synthase-like GNAT family acetyltransferase
MTGKAAFRRAAVQDIEALSELVIRSKASNGYSDEFMQAFMPELIVRPELLRVGEVWVCEVGGEMAGLLHLVCDGKVAELEAMFVEPAYKGQGLGRQMFDYAEMRLRELGAQRVELDADPFAAGFYEAMGCSLVGYSPSGSIPGRILPRMRKTVR